MRTQVEQALYEGKIRARRNSTISKVLDIVLPMLIVLCLLLWRERYNVIEVKNGEISLTQIYAWGCCARELRRMPVDEVASVLVKSWGGGAKAGGACAVEIYDQAGNKFNKQIFSRARMDRAYEVREMLLHAISGKSACRVGQSTQTHYFFFALILTVITLIRWWMIRVVRKAEGKADRQWEYKRRTRAKDVRKKDLENVRLEDGQAKRRVDAY